MEEQITNPVEVPVKKKSNGCLISFLVLLVIFILLGVVGYLSYKEIVEKFKPKDLGISYSQEDLTDFFNNIGLDADPEKICIGCEVPVYSDPKEVNLVITNEQASAAFEYINENMPVGSISNTQIKFNDGLAEVTTTLSYNGQTFPIYLAGTLEKDTITSVKGNIQSLKAGGISVPESIVQVAEEGILSIFNKTLSDIGDNVRIDVLEITSDGLVFEGILPSKAK